MKLKGFINSVSGRLFCIFLVVWIFVSALVFFCLQYSQTKMTQTIQDSQTEQVKYYSALVYADLSRVTGLLKEMVMDEDVKVFWTRRDNTFDYQDYQAFFRSYTKLKAYRNTSMYIEDAFLVIPQTSELLRANLGVVQIPDTYQSYVESCRNGDSSVFFTQDDRMIYLSKGVDGSIVGIEISARQIRQSLNALNPGYFDCFLMDGKEGKILGNRTISKEGHMVYQALNKTSFQELDNISTENGNYIGVMVDTPENQYQICVFAKRSQFFRELTFFEWLWLPVCLFFLTIPILIGLLWRRYLSNPLRQLTMGMHAVEKGDWSYRLPAEGAMEFQYVFSQFNHMTSYMEQLIKDVYEKQLQMERIQRQQLQSQINPHFLYNSFYMGYRLAKSGNMDNVARLCMYLGDYFKVLTYANAGKTTLQQELHFIDTYLQLNKMRFPERLSYRIDADPSLDSMEVLPLLLQPLVENAVMHGIEKTSEPGMILVEVKKQEGKIVFRVSDTSPTATEETVSLLMVGINRPEMPDGTDTTWADEDTQNRRIAQGRAPKGFGLWNVQKRLLALGSEVTDGLHFTVSEDQGFCASFSLKQK